MVRRLGVLAALLVVWASGGGAARAADAAASLRAAGGLTAGTPDAVAAGDMDGDGALTIVDAVRLRRGSALRRGGTVTRTAANRYGPGYGVILDDPLLNGNPGARLVVTHRYVAAYNGAIGVWYYAALGRWVIFNEDRSPMADGEVFHYAFADAAAVSTAEGGFRVFLEGLGPASIPLATHSYNAAYGPAPLGVGFANPPRWYAYSETYADLPAGETYFVVDAGAYGGIAFQDAPEDVRAIGVYLSDPRLNGNPSAILLVQHGYVRAPNPSPMGVWYDEVFGLWMAYNENGTPLATGEAVHYLIAGP